MSTRLTAFTTTHRVIMRVHDNTTVVRTTSQPARTSSLTGLFQCVVRVADATYRCLTSRKNLTSLSRREFNHTITALTRSQLSEITSRTNELGTLSRTHLNVVDDGTYGNVGQGKRITYLRRCVSPRHQGCTNLQSIRSNNITFFTISIEKQCDTSRTVRIVLNCLHYSWNTILLSLEVDNTIFFLVTTAHIADCHLTGVVTTAGRTLTVNERLLWHGCSNIFERANNLVSLTRCNGL